MTAITIAFAPVAAVAVKAFGFSDHPITGSQDHPIFLRVWFSDPR
jgi:hypothetical protein